MNKTIYPQILVCLCLLLTKFTYFIL